VAFYQDCSMPRTASYKFILLDAYNCGIAFLTNFSLDLYISLNLQTHGAI